MDAVQVESRQSKGTESHDDVSCVHKSSSHRAQVRRMENANPADGRTCIVAERWILLARANNTITGRMYSSRLNILLSKMARTILIN